MSERAGKDRGKKPETRGRKKLPAGKKRLRMIAAKVNDEEYEVVRQLAALRGITMGEWVRRRAIGEL